jgi:hypothetical protein
MNAADGMNEEESPGNIEQNREGLSSSPKHSDCGNLCNLAVGGARPKVRNLVCNIPNGITPHLADDAARVNNNVLPLENLESVLDDSIASSSGISKLRNGMNLNCENGVENTNGIDSYLCNSVLCHAAVNKYPLKVRNSYKSNNLDLSTESNGCCPLEAQHGITRRWDDTDDSSSDTGNEGEDGLSADECCIYTYKGDQMADLPSSFFTLDVLTRSREQGTNGEFPRKEDVEARGGDRNGGGSSPEMDFLEMDFDPGPSCEQDSEEDSDCCDIQDEEVTAVYPGHATELKLEIDCGADSHGHNDFGATLHDDHRNASASAVSVGNSPEECSMAQSSPPQPTWALPHSRSSDPSLVAANSSAIIHRSAGCWLRRDSWGHHCTNGDLCSPGEASDLDNETWGETMMWNSGSLRVQNEGALVDTRKHALHSALYHCIMAKRLVLDKEPSSSNGDESNMVSALYVP